MARKKKGEEMIENQEVQQNEEQVEEQNVPAKDPMAGLTVEEQIALLKRKLAKAKGEVTKVAGEKVEKVIPPEPTSTSISSSFELDEEAGNVIVTTEIGDITYKSFPKDGGKGIARTTVTIEGEQKHEYNNVGIANVCAGLKERFVDQEELDGIIYFALKSRKECIKGIDDEYYVKAAAIRAEVREKKQAEREQIKNENAAKKEKHVAELEAKIAELEAALNN